MPRRNIEFRTSDQVTLRGWFFTPESKDDDPLPCLVMSHGFSALKEMDLDTFANYFIKNLKITCLVFDNRGFGSSDTGLAQHRHEIIPSIQTADISDAITYACSLPEVNANKIGIWGSSYSGGHVLQVGATDRRVKAVLSQVPCVNGWDNFNRLVRPDFAENTNKLLAEDRLNRLAGKEPAMIPVVDENPSAPSALPTPDSYAFFTGWAKKSEWQNEVTIRSLEAFRAYDPSSWIHRISPTPLLMTVATNDLLTPTDLALTAFAKANEPKELQMLPGGHFDGYSGPNFECNAGRQADFLRRMLC